MFAQTETFHDAILVIIQQITAEAVTPVETPPLAKRKHSYCSNSSTLASHKEPKQVSAAKQKKQRVVTLPLLAVAPTDALQIWLHICDLQSGFFRSGCFRQKLAGRTADEPTLLYQLLPLHKLERYMKGQGPKQRREPSYTIALSGIDSAALQQFDASSSRVAFAMTHADGSNTDHMVCDISIEYDGSTSSYCLRVTPHAGGHVRLATAMWAVPSSKRRGKIHGCIKFGKTLYHFSEPFVTGSYSTGTPAKAAVHTFVAKQQ
jgi:hypothetical protein